MSHKVNDAPPLIPPSSKHNLFLKHKPANKHASVQKKKGKMLT